MTELTLRGERRDPGQVTDGLQALYADDEFEYRLVEEVTPGSDRSAVRSTQLTLEAGDVLEVEDRDGVVTFHTAASLPEGDLSHALGRAPTRSGTDPLVRVTRAKLTLPERIARDVETVHSAIGDDRMDFVWDRVIDAAASAAMKRIVAWVEKPISDAEYRADSGDRRRGRAKEHGLYRIDEDLLVEPERRITSTQSSAGSEDPYLLLIHGTFSHTEAAFGALRRKEEWKRLAARYGDRILALEHSTLGSSPLENAREAVRRLPRGARIHIVSHSRGGLVGDVLALGSARRTPVGADRRRPVRSRAEERELGAAFEELRTVMQRQELAVTRFVRVACPGSGTTLASRRLDLYGTALFNLLRLVPGVGQSGVVEMVKRFALTLLDKRSDPRLVPGIEAMMPESPFIRMLATAPPVDDGMAVIAGDIEGRGLLDRLKVIATNLFYLEDHDLVVNTAAMDGGVRRVDGRRAFFKGPGVSHSSYFSDDVSRRALCDWLSGTDSDVEPFTPIRAPRVAIRTRDGGPAGPPLVVVPDIFGSTLVAEDGVVVWPEVDGLATRTLAGSLAMDQDLSPGELVDLYDPLVDRLSAEFAVHPVPYDWRRSFEEAAGRLVEQIVELDGPAAPVRVVTHGAGAHVLAAALRRRPELLGEGSRAGRLVLLSPALDGTARAAALVEGAGELAAQIRLLDPGCGKEGLSKLFGEFPGLQEASLPLDTEGLDGAVAVFGAAPATVVADGGAVSATAAGDGNVVLPRPGQAVMPTWFSGVPFAEMPRDPTLLDDVGRLVQGSLPRHLMERPAEADPALVDLEVLDGRIQFPAGQDLVTSAMGGAARTRVAGTGQALRVSVTHGDLEHLDVPILVGVYEGTPLRGAEKALDRRMGGILQTRVALGRFPGPVGTTDVVESSVEGAPHAVVIGMGHNGDLNASRLASGVHQALLGLAARRMEHGDDRSLTVATVLIGSSGAVSLPVPTSLSAIVTGTLRANRRLREVPGSPTVEHLMVVELYEDRAIEATNAVRELPADVHLVSDERLVIDETMQVGHDGLPGLPPPEYHRDRWRTIRVSVQRDQATSVDPHARFTDLVSLEFTSIGVGAGAQQRLSENNRGKLEAIIASAIEDATVDPQTYNTLYELLVPLGLKGQSRETENLLYVLDEAASTIPFEMLSPRLDDEGVQPFAVDVGLLRQLETSTFRENVRPSTGHRALVIGDPPTTRFERLPGAIAEARRVRGVLEEHGYQVESLIPADTDDFTSVGFLEIMNALFRYDYRIVHIAAHGDYDPSRPDRSGVVIGDDQFLTAREIQQMPTTPDMVFLNACHIGSMVPRSALGGDGETSETRQWRPDRLAASISRRLIDNGVRTVVAAGWAVADAAATDFAAHLYDRLLAGVDLGTAVTTARSRIYRDHRHVNTWGAYQVYGQPAFRIDRVEPDRRSPVRIVSRKQLTNRLRGLIGEAERADTTEKVEALRREAAGLLAGAADSWLGGEQQALSGSLAFALGDYGPAVDRLRRAVDDWGAEAPLNAVERLVNALVKLALERRDETSAELLDAARQYVEHLNGLGITPERSGIHGSFWRRQLLLTPSTGAIVSKRTAIRRALDAYRRGWETAVAAGRADFYLGPNLALLMWASGSDESGEIADVLSRSREVAAEGSGFWARVTAADVALVEAVVAGRVEEDREAIAAAYRQAVRSGSSRMQRRAVAEHLEIVAATVPRKSETRRLRDGLEALRGDLAGDLG